MTFTSTEQDIMTYNNSTIFAQYPRGFTKNFMLAGEGNIKAFNNIIDNYGLFKLGYDCEASGNTKKKYHAIQWAAEACFSVFRNISESDSEMEKSEYMVKHEYMLNKIKEKCKNNQIRTMLLNDDNCEHYFSNLELEEIKNIV